MTCKLGLCCWRIPESSSDFVDNGVTQLTSPLPFFPHPRSHVQSNKTQSTTKSTFTVLHMLHQSYWILDKECPAQHHTSARLQSIAHVEKNTNSVMCSFLFSFYPFMFFSSCPLLGAGVYLPHPPPAIGGGLGPEPWLILPILRRGYPGGPLPSSYPELDEELEPPLLVKSGRTILWKNKTIKSVIPQNMSVMKESLQGDLRWPSNTCPFAI